MKKIKKKKVKSPKMFLCGNYEATTEKEAIKQAYFDVEDSISPGPKVIIYKLVPYARVEKIDPKVEYIK